MIPAGAQAHGETETVPHPARPRPKTRAWVWATVLLAVLGTVEFFCFDHFGSHQLTGIYPRWNDQIQYLSEAYTGFEYARSHGLAAGLWHTLTNPSAQGTLHDFAAVVVFKVAGASRSAALALNMLALIAWQAALAFAVARRTRSLPLAFAAAMLPLALKGPWENVPGSAYDFRLDHLALCALGVSSTIALLTDGFRSRRWSCFFGVSVGVVLLTRFLTGTYFVLIFAAFFGWAATGPDRARRLVNVLYAAVLAAALAGPIFWINREWVWNYYYIGHYVGPESAIRNQNFGLLRSTAYVWGILGERHLGAWFGVFAGMTAAALGARRLTRRPTQPPADSGREATPSPQVTRELLVIGGAYLLAPALILTLHPQKSEVVLSALAPGAVLLVVGAWLAVVRACGGSLTRPALTGLAAILASSALEHFWRTQTRILEQPARVAEMRQVNTAADYVLATSVARHLERPRIAVDYITDAFDAQVMRVICYERHHVWIDFDMRLPTGIAEPAPGLVRERIRESDFVFLGTGAEPLGPFPYDRALASLRPELAAWCDSHLREVRRFTLNGRTVVLYERPAAAP